EDLAARAPDQLRVLPLDVADGPAVAAAVAGAIGAWGRVDVVVTNAGEGLLGAVEEVPEELVRRSFEVNFFGAWRVIQGFLPHLRRQRSGHLVLVSAAAAIVNYPGFGAYGAAKRALEGLGESLAQELRPCGVRVTMVQPGPFRTGFARRALATPVPSLADYEPTVGRFRQLLGGWTENSPATRPARRRRSGR
ncbi:MAG: SDR family NAD(P)-dependent oxidoreductase, partial [Verrucomicrobiota bacterium]